MQSQTSHRSLSNPIRKRRHAPAAPKPTRSPQARPRPTATRNRAPLIGITPDSGAGMGGSPEEPLVFLLERYPRAILEAGGIPIILPLLPSTDTIAEILASLDGIVVTGGNFDIHPGLYGEEPLERVGRIKEPRTRFELELIGGALERDLPILGICGGAQAINVALGGSLYQDIATQHPGAAEHEQGALKERGGHLITICEGTRLRRIVETSRIEVNTTHHQAVRRLGSSLIVNATADDGIIEGIEGTDHSFVLGVQWHPEWLTRRVSSQRNIFASFVSACVQPRSR